jgi:transmembrane sensor
MNDANKYLDYTAADFAKDPLFRNWVLVPDEENSKFWTNWLSRYPDKKAVVENARWQMLPVRVSEEVIVQERLDAVWNSIQKRKAAILEEASAGVPALPPASATKVIPLFSFRAWQQMAAIFLLVSFGAGILYYFVRPAHPSGQIISTAYGQIKTVRLPDHSEVVLNGNSTLSFPDKWTKAEDRQVSLQGEAYFSVKHTQNHQKFRVNLKGGVQVTVVGTSFTVTQRPTKTQVVLNEGQVKLTKKQQQLYGLRTVILKEEVMLPGDLIEVQKKAPLFHKTRVEQPALYAAFTQHKIIFKNTLLSEVTRVLEDTYGYRVYITKPGLAEKHFSGTTPTNDIEMLFSAIEDLFQVQVIRQGKDIIIK